MQKWQAWLSEADAASEVQTTDDRMVEMRFLTAIAGAVLLALPAAVQAQEVIFYTQNSSFQSQLATLGASYGWTVEGWISGAPVHPFSYYDALVVGWGGDATYGDLNAQNAAITAARGNRTFISGQDADVHEYYGSNPPAAQLFLKNAVNWAAAGTGLGLVVLPDFSGWMSDPSSPLYLEMFGHYQSLSGDSVIIPGPTAGYPVNAGLTSASLSNWGSSYHETYDTNTPGYTTINLSGDYENRAVTILTESEAAGATTSTPEPATMSLLATGLIGLVGMARRRCKNA